MGREFESGRYECVDLVNEVLEREFGRSPNLPRIAGARARDRAVAALTAQFAARTESPVEGDGVLLRALGRRQGVGHHIGVWIWRSGTPYVLHCAPALGTVLHPVRSLAGRGYELRGIYRWI